MSFYEFFKDRPLIAAIDPARPVAVALSGGPDSMALTALLSRHAANRDGPQIHALTVDHALRPDSGTEANQVGQWLKDWPFIQHTILKRSPPENTDTRIMEDARQDRYALMAGYCQEHGIEKLFTAHHQNDQAETVLFRLAKGSGLDGLSGMRPAQEYSDNLTILRPLLDIPKTDLVAFCESESIPFIKDPSNENEDYARPRLRNAQSVLEAEGLSAKRLSVTASRLNRAREALDIYANEAFKTALTEQTAKQIVLSYTFLKKEPEETRLRILIKAMAALHSESNQPYGPRREKLESLMKDLFNEVEPFQKRTLGGFIFERSQDSLRIAKEM